MRGSNLKPFVDYLSQIERNIVISIEQISLIHRNLFKRDINNLGGTTLNLKQVAGEKAAEYVKDGMVVGLGTGSTTYYAIKKIGSMVNDGLEIIGIPTSIQTEDIASESGIKLSDLQEHPKVDLTIDGADEVDPNLNLIKGMGGALLREKIVARASKKEVIVVDDSKLVDVLGSKSPLPVEVTQLAWKNCQVMLERLGSKAELRKKNGETFISDNKNYIIDCDFQSIQNPWELEKTINNLPGVLENGLFLGLTDLVIVSAESGIKLLGEGQ
jgi:ribose 5-phosphate isomerase A